MKNLLVNKPSITMEYFCDNRWNIITIHFDEKRMLNGYPSATIYDNHKPIRYITPREFIPFAMFGYHVCIERSPKAYINRLIKVANKYIKKRIKESDENSRRFSAFDDFFEEATKHLQ